MSYTYSEISSQYLALNQTFSYIEDKKSEIINFFSLYKKLNFTFIGCGSSYMLCKSAEFIVKKELNRNASTLAGGDLMLHIEEYKNIYNNSILIIPTRSGSTSEIIRSINAIKEKNKNIPIVAITCKKNSTISQVVDLVIELPWAFDKSVCQTRSVTNLYAALYLLFAFTNNDIKRISDLKQIIKLGPSYLARIEPKIKSIAKLDWNNVITLADGECQGIASEGALAFTEIARKIGSSYNILDVRHGPMVLIQKDTLVLILQGNNYNNYTKDLIKDLLAKKAKIVFFSAKPCQLSSNVLAQINFNLNVNDAALGIPFIAIPQLIAYYKAIEEELNPDKPEGLDAWINL